jgi:hypothetical protein
MAAEQRISHRLRDLKRHLKHENPILEDVVESFRELDRISRRLGFLTREDSHAIRTSWWPLISVLGVYSSGKSSFINHYLGRRLQATGNQAVDDKFTVICFAEDKTPRVLPGVALDADPRFPFYRMSQAIDDAARGEGRRIDAYLQLKTCASEKLRGKILIDSPGFDADAQRTSTLRITDHIIDLSDLVLVFFDARHPESGSMHDTLEHLVRRTIGRRDSNKFIYILNQIDTTSPEDNTEEVFASWQRALAQSGMTAGTCCAIYIPELALPIADPAVRTRFEAKRDAGLNTLYQRIEQVGVERAYRIVGMLEQTARALEREAVPRLRQFLATWRRRTLWVEAVLFAVLALLAFAATIYGGYWHGLSLRVPLWDATGDYPRIRLLVLGLLAAAAVYIHFSIRRRLAERLAAKLAGKDKAPDFQLNYRQALRKNSRWFRSLFRRQPAGWSRRTARTLAKILDDSQSYVQKLNDMYTNPSGGAQAASGDPRHSLPQ